MRVVRAVLAFLGGGIALTLLWGEGHSYENFLPLRGYEPIHSHLMAPQEGLFLGTYVVLGTIAACCFGLAAFWTTRRSITAALARLAGRLTDRGWMILLALVAALSALVVGQLVLEGAFMTDDEMAMLFQARLLCAGRLWAEPTPFSDVFHYAMMIEEPRWYGIYPIGHPALMALSLLLSGDARYIFVIVAAAWVVLTFLLARRLFDRQTAILAASLLCLSPFFVLTSGTLASELTSGLFLLLAASMVARLEDRHPWLIALVLGLSLGVAYAARPYTALAVGLPLAGWVAWRWFRRGIPLWFPLLCLLGMLPFVVAHLWSNAELTGNVWITTYEVNFPDRFRIGFGQDAFGVIHTPQLALGVTALVLFQLNAWLLGWPLSLIPLGCALALGRLRGVVRLLLVITPIVTLIAFMPVPMAGVQDTGPLYYTEILPLLIILAARGLLLLGQHVRGALSGRGRDLVIWLALAATLVGALVFWQQQITMLRALVRFNQEPYEVAEQTIDGRALVFVENIQTTPPSSWVLGVRPPRPDLGDRIVFGHVVNPARANEALRWTRGRRAYFLSRDRQTGVVSLVPLPAPPQDRR